MPTTLVLLTLLAAGPAQTPAADADAARLAEAARIVAAQRQQLGAMTSYYGNRYTAARLPFSPYVSTARPSMISPYQSYRLAMPPALPQAAVPPGGMLPPAAVPLGQPAVPPVGGRGLAGNGLPQAAAAQNQTQFTAEEQAEAQKQREWLLARLMANPRLDAGTLRAAERDLARLNPSQLRTLVETYKLWQEQRKANAAVEQQDVLNQAQQNLQQSVAFRDHLSREFQLRLLEQHALLNALQPPLLNPGYGSGYGYGGLPPAGFNPPVPFVAGAPGLYGW